VSLSYSRFFDRFGFQELAWADNPQNTTEGTLVVLEYGSRYTLHGIKAVVELSTGWHGIYVLGGTEIMHYRLHQHWTWSLNTDNVLAIVYPERLYQHYTLLSPVIGAGWLRQLGSGFSANAVLSHSTASFNAGTQLTISFQYEL
jgi:hypothetical protein